MTKEKIPCIIKNITLSAVTETATSSRKKNAGSGSLN